MERTYAIVRVGSYKGRPEYQVNRVLVEDGCVWKSYEATDQLFSNQRKLISFIRRLPGTILTGIWKTSNGGHYLRLHRVDDHDNLL
jgi:hypothetical protein